MSEENRTKANVYVNPNAPKWLGDMLGEIFPDANKVSAEEMQTKMDKQIGDETMHDQVNDIATEEILNRWASSHEEFLNSQKIEPMTEPPIEPPIVCPHCGGAIVSQ
jgi:hypothetical protein